MNQTNRPCTSKITTHLPSSPFPWSLLHAATSNIHWTKWHSEHKPWFSAIPSKSISSKQRPIHPPTIHHSVSLFPCYPGNDVKFVSMPFQAESEVHFVDTLSQVWMFCYRNCFEPFLLQEFHPILLLCELCFPRMFFRIILFCRKSQ